MSDSPKTRPGELASIKELAGGDPYRTEVLVTLGVMRDHLEQSRNWQKGTDEWRALHDTNDKLSFQSIETRLSDLNSKYLGVSSGVGDYNDTKAQATGAKKLALGIIAIIGGVGACILFALEVINRLNKP